MQVGIYDKVQVIMNMQSNVDKAALIQRMGEISQLSGQVQQLQEQVETLSGDLQTRERELFHTRMRAEIAEATKPVQKAVSNLQSTAKAEQEKQRELTRQTAEDLSYLSKQAINSKTEAPSA
jgi:predicted  nucleic acid-binding Zn-ribbon protein